MVGIHLRIIALLLISAICIVFFILENKSGANAKIKRDPHEIIEVFGTEDGLEKVDERISNLHLNKVPLSANRDILKDHAEILKERTKVTVEYFSFKKVEPRYKDNVSQILVCSADHIARRKMMRAMYKPSNVQAVIDCEAIMNNDVMAIRTATHPNNTYTPIDYLDNRFLQISEDCEGLSQNMSYPQCAYSREELDFPIAFSITCHKDFVQVERLLRLIYQPQNMYCIHPDKKSNPYFHQALHNLASCFPNVFVASEQVYLVYDNHTRIQADINCMKELMHKSNSWRYVINIIGQDFPLKTNKEIVTILKSLNGASDVERESAHDVKLFDVIPFSDAKLSQGRVYGAYSRQFVTSVIGNPASNKFLVWLRDSENEAGLFWSSFYSQYESTNGTLTGNAARYMSSYSVNDRRNCRGRMVNDLCIFGIRDVHMLVKRREMFLHKLYHDHPHPTTMNCLEEWIHAKITRALDKINSTQYI